MKKEWEVFFDECYYGMWACRNKHDRRFNSPDLHHFDTEAQAELKKEELEKNEKSKKS